MKQEKDLVLKRNTEITTADTDMLSRIQLGSLVNLLIQSAISSADNLGFSFVNLKDHKMLWVLSRLTVEIYKPLKWYDVAEVETWPKDIERLLYLRDFVIRNQNGDVVAKASSAWLAIDIDRRRPKIVKGKNADRFTRLKSKHALNYIPEKLDAVCEGDVYNKHAEYVDIDLNNHVTATRYIDWMMDSFSPQFHKSNYPKKLSINYNKEVLWGETIEIKKQQNGDNYNFQGTNTNSGAFSFCGMIQF